VAKAGRALLKLLVTLLSINETAGGDAGPVFGDEDEEETGGRGEG
jgi:hypothetical protein